MDNIYSLRGMKLKAVRFGPMRTKNCDLCNDGVFMMYRILLILISSNTFIIPDILFVYIFRRWFQSFFQFRKSP